MTQAVLIFSRRLDGHADRLIAKIKQFGAQPVRINVEEINTYRFDFESDKLPLILPSGEVIDGLSITSVFVRALPSSEDFNVHESTGAVSVESYIGIQKEATFHDWLNTLSTKVPIFNNFQAAQLCMGKGYQHHLAKKIGLKTPNLYIGDSPTSAERFVRTNWAINNSVCTKPVAHKTVILDGVKSARFTEKFEEEQLREISSLEGCPLIFQNYIPKAYELRITVINDQVLACKISSQEAGGKTAVDWRHYNIARTPHEQYFLPDEVKNKLINFHKLAGLRFSAFDFIKTPSGEYIFLETNPSGQWLWLEDLVGLPISETLAKELINP